MQSRVRIEILSFVRVITSNQQNDASCKRLGCAEGLDGLRFGSLSKAEGELGLGQQRRKPRPFTRRHFQL